jgi:hypothetical protein
MANRFEIAVNKKTGKRIPRVKRTCHYVQNPSTYEMECPKCGGSNIEWSEWADCLWCYSCKKDYKITIKSSGMFSGPIPIQTAELLGMCFDRWDMEKKKFIIRKYIEGRSDEENDKDIYLTKSEYIKYRKRKNEKTIL